MGNFLHSGKSTTQQILPRVKSSFIRNSIESRKISLPKIQAYFCPFKANALSCNLLNFYITSVWSQQIFIAIYGAISHWKSCGNVKFFKILSIYLYDISIDPYFYNVKLCTKKAETSSQPVTKHGDLLIYNIFSK